MTERMDGEYKLSVKQPFSGKSTAARPATMGTFDDGIPVHQPSFSGKLRKPRNDEVRSREHLTPSEVANVTKAARKTGRHGHRDATLILIAYRHGLRPSELVALRWDQVDLEQGVLHVTRLKGGTASTHPLRGA